MEIQIKNKLNARKFINIYHFKYLNNKTALITTKIHHYRNVRVYDLATWS